MLSLAHPVEAIVIVMLRSYRRWPHDPPDLARPRGRPARCARRRGIRFQTPPSRKIERVFFFLRANTSPRQYIGGLGAPLTRQQAAGSCARRHRTTVRPDPLQRPGGPNSEL